MIEFPARFIQLFSQEIKFAYQNKTVMGGLDKIITLWQSEAQKNQVPQLKIQEITHLIGQYQSASIESRKKIITSIIQSLHVFEKNETKLAKNQNLDGDIFQGEDSSSGAGLDAPVTVINRIGEHTAKLLAKINIHTIKDLLYYYPRRYRDLSSLKTISRLNPGEDASIIGSIFTINLRKSANGKLRLVEAVVSDGSGYLQVTWFNQPWLVKSLPKGKQIILSGKVERFMGRVSMTNPEVESLEKEQLHTNRIVPIYPLTAGVSQKNLRRIIFETVKYWSPKMKDYLDPQLRTQQRLIELSRAINNIHFPQNNELLKNAIERLSFDEIFFMQLGVLSQKHLWENNNAETFTIAAEKLQSFMNRLDFQLTNAQQNVIDQIMNDLNSGKPMNRLIQGDVGSGKTVIAALAILIVLQKNAQAVFLAPTSLLAEQHYHTLMRIFSGSGKSDAVLAGEKMALLIGDTPEKEKEAIRRKLLNDEIKLVIGTHAILESNVNFKWLQLVVIDEQHRFGVEQRALLRSKGENPHLLVMTATPIPRSLALTLYGDLNISVMDEMPLGRIPIETHILLPSQRDQAYQLIKKEVENGHQVFIVYPQVENEEDELFKSAVDEFQRISEKIFPEFSVGLMHGRLKQKEKDEIMRKFRDNKLNILVSTTVIEVGMDIPNATVVLVENADHFGLAQLHQIRGRVGRANQQSYCLLIPENEDKFNNERLTAMAETNDGFKLAEYDLRQRGPGDFLGTRQSGYTGLRLASLTDTELIIQARGAAQKVFQDDPGLNHPTHKFLKMELKSYWPDLSGDIS